MRFLLDTNVCVDYLTGRFPQVPRKLRSFRPAELCLSSIVVAELRHSADKRRRFRNHRRLNVLADEIPVRDFDRAAAKVYGNIRSALEKKGRLISPNDMLIAAHALSRGSVLVTDNVTEFRRIKGLEVENWRES